MPDNRYEGYGGLAFLALVPCGDGGDRLVIRLHHAERVAWCAAGHRSTEPAQQLALDKLGLEPILDLGLRLGEGTGALTALPVLRSAVLALREVALLDDLRMPAQPVEAPINADRQAQGHIVS